MSKHKKALEKLCVTPTPAGFKWSELQGVLTFLGYEMIQGSGSRRKFFHREKQIVIICHQPHPSPDVDKGCIDDVVEHLKKHGFV